MSEAELATQARALAEGIEAALPAWIVGCVTRVMVAWAGSVPDDVEAAAEAAADEARAETVPAVRALLDLDIDAQATTPMALVRLAVRYPTRVLREAGVPPVQRDRFAEQSFPDDVYDLTPAALADLDPALNDLGIAWGAAKAFVHKQRHRAGA